MFLYALIYQILTGFRNCITVRIRRTRNLASNIDLHTHAGSAFNNRVTFTCDLLTPGKCTPRSCHRVYARLWLCVSRLARLWPVYRDSRSWHRQKIKLCDVYNVDAYQELIVDFFFINADTHKHRHRRHWSRYPRMHRLVPACERMTLTERYYTRESIKQTNQQAVSRSLAEPPPVTTSTRRIP